MSYILDRLKKEQYYILRTPSGFGEYAYNIVSKEGIRDFYESVGEGYGLTKTMVLGPITPDMLELDFIKETPLLHFINQ